MGQIAKQAVNSGLVDQAVAGVKDSIKSNATNTVSKTKDPLLEMDLQMFGNKGSSAGSTGSNVEKVSGAADDFAKEPFLPEEYYKNNRLPSKIESGTSSLDKFDDLGNLKQTKFYDQYGREKGWIDYTNHGRPDSHSAPHWHEYIYDAEFPLGKKIDHKFDINPPFLK